MPVCARCGVAFIEGESHRCEPNGRSSSTWFVVALTFFVLLIVLWSLLGLFSSRP
jgi:hypothetical protein